MRDFESMKKEYETLFNATLIIPVNLPGSFEDFCQAVEKAIESKKPLDGHWFGENLPKDTMI